SGFPWPWGQRRMPAAIWTLQRASTQRRPKWSAESPPSEVDRPPIDRQRGLSEDLRQRRVGVRGAADLPRRRLELECDRGLGDQVRCVRADQVDAERLVGLLVGDDLG